MNAQPEPPPPICVSQYPTGIHGSVPAEVYHRKELGVVNCSALKQLARTPAHYKAWLTGEETHETPALIFGRALHALVLEPHIFAAEYALKPDFGDLRTNAGKALRDAWQSKNEGVTTVSADDWQRLHAMRDSVMADPIAGKLFVGGEAEVTAVWQSNGLICKARLDYWIESRAIGVDLKSTEDASPAAFAKSVAQYRYHVQHAHYCEGMQVAGHPLRAFLFVAVEKTAPYAVAIYAIDADAEARGQGLREREMIALNDSLRTDTWAGYATTIQTLALPRWALID